MISFQIKRSGAEIEIYVDDAGIDALIVDLSELRGQGGHIHLRVPSAGGSEFGDTTPWGSMAVRV
jgi:hypothetical protein